MFAFVLKSPSIFLAVSVFEDERFPHPLQCRFMDLRPSKGQLTAKSVPFFDFFSFFDLRRFWCLLAVSGVHIRVCEQILEHFKKKSMKKINIFWSKIDFEIFIGNFPKIFENQNFHWIFNGNLKISKIFEKSKNRKFWLFEFFIEKSSFSLKIEKSKISSFENFQKFSDQNFKIDFRSKNFGLFPWTFF